MRSDETGRQHPDAHPKVERGQVGRSSRTTQLMRRHVHEQALKRGHAYTETDTDRQRASEIDKRCMHASENSERYRQENQRDDRDGMNLPVIHQASGNQTGRADAYRQVNEEKARRGNIDLPPIQHDKREQHPVWNRDQRVRERRRKRFQ